MLLEVGPSTIGRLQQDVRRTTRALVEGEMGTVGEKIRAFLADDQILYLPTYRRIEKELKALLGDIDDLRPYRRDSSLPRMGVRTDAYAEFVEFGMEDVSKRLTETLSDLNNNNRKEFNTLAGSYLRDVIRGIGAEFSVEEIRLLTDEAITQLLGRVEENTLSDKDKFLLRESVDRLRISNSKPNEQDAYIYIRA
jgi:hypothetical protein